MRDLDPKADKRMTTLWLRYLTEIGDKTQTVSQDLMAEPAIRKAVGQLEESAFTDAQLQGYEKFLDMISVENTLVGSAERRGREAGLAEGHRKGLAEGREDGIAEGRREGVEEPARNQNRMGAAPETAAAATGLSVQ